MAMVDLAENQSDVPVPLSDIARRQNLSISYLEQLFLKLRRAKLVNSVRGSQGGYNLVKSISDISVIEIIAAVDNPIRATRCESKKSEGCQLSGERCATHDLWAELEFVIRNFLTHVTLQEIKDGKVSGLRYLFNPNTGIMERKIQGKGGGNANLS